ncbi:hypothetical protein M231_04756 [Tremella mesenterica]|uniref:Uncharacterized protein n=1 Tax=Tremella mesenterica TaxID=5217 RepID=A0A4Q1BK20_TREME|nr:hypothetical protein M231_04756 [Tremella mesenterica]
MSLPIQIRSISSSQTLHLRKSELWPDTPLSSQSLPYDILSTTLHLGAFIISSQDTFSSLTPPPTANSMTNSLEGGYEPDETPTACLTPPKETGKHDETPIACLTLVLEPYLGKLPEHISNTTGGETLNTVQLHKFAVKFDLQGKGIGRQMLQYVYDLFSTSAMVEGDESLKETLMGVQKPILLHLDSRKVQAGFYIKAGLEVLDGNVFIKRGPTGDGYPHEYVRMGRLIK